MAALEVCSANLAPSLQLIGPVLHVRTSERNSKPWPTPYQISCTVAQASTAQAVQVQQQQTGTLDK